MLLLNWTTKCLKRNTPPMFYLKLHKSNANYLKGEELLSFEDSVIAGL